jgi:hypothetical protein
MHWQDEAAAGTISQWVCKKAHRLRERYRRVS